MDMTQKLFPIKLMLVSMKNIEKLENLKELMLLQNQEKETRLLDKLAKQNIYENIKNVFRPVTDRIKNTSEKLTETLTDLCVENNQALENLNDKTLEIMKDIGIMASYLLCPLSKNH